MSTLHSQLRFVRAVQRVDTTGVEPLRAIRDETEEGTAEQTVRLADVEGALRRERLVGHRRRPRRVRDDDDNDDNDNEVERWDALATASTTAGRYFVVEVGAAPAKDGGGGGGAS